MYLCTAFEAQMAESVDALVSNTSGATRAGSTPALGTAKISKRHCKSTTCGVFIFALLANRWQIVFALLILKPISMPTSWDTASTSKSQNKGYNGSSTASPILTPGKSLQFVAVLGCKRYPCSTQLYIVKTFTYSPSPYCESGKASGSCRY